MILETKNKGMWYPGNKNELAEMISSFLHQAPSSRINNAIALVIPHAGYQYSGPTAAHSFRSVEGNTYKRILVIGPSHRAAVYNKIIVPESQSYRTPLGEGQVDSEFIKLLCSSDYFVKSDKPFWQEHSVDNEIPFIHYLYPDVQIVPMIMGHFEKNDIRRVVEIMRPLIGQDTLIVVSSDFIHYGESFNFTPFKTKIKENLEKWDMEAVHLLKGQHFEEFYDYVERTGSTICGYMSISLLLELLPSETQCKLQKYETSGNLTKDYTHTVSYVAATFAGRW